MLVLPHVRHRDLSSYVLSWIHTGNFCTVWRIVFLWVFSSCWETYFEINIFKSCDICQMWSTKSLRKITKMDRDFWNFYPKTKVQAYCGNLKKSCLSLLLWNYKTEDFGRGENISVVGSIILTLMNEWQSWDVLHFFKFIILLKKTDLYQISRFYFFVFIFL